MSEPTLLKPSKINPRSKKSERQCLNPFLNVLTKNNLLNWREMPPWKKLNKISENATKKESSPNSTWLEEPFALSVLTPLISTLYSPEPTVLSKWKSNPPILKAMTMLFKPVWLVMKLQLTNSKKLLKESPFQINANPEWTRLKNS